MITNTLELREKYLRASMFPSIFCTACGIGNVLHYTIQAIDNVGIDITKTVFVSGIGCSSRLPGYVKADGLHTTHGRALAFATGIHAADPDLNIIVFTGDGDCVGLVEDQPLVLALAGAMPHLHLAEEHERLLLGATALDLEIVDDDSSNGHGHILAAQVGGSDVLVGE